nr:MAG TPA: helix-turn-helix domain protein [Caudoviricetes sp.]
MKKSEQSSTTSCKDIWKEWEWHMELLEIPQKIQSLSEEVNELKNALNATKSPQQEKIMTTEEARKYMKVSRSRIDMWRQQRILPSIMVSKSGRWLYRQSDLDELFTEWDGYDISTVESIQIAKELKKREAKQSKATPLSNQKLAN